MPKDECKAACLQVIEQYGAGLIDFMVAAAEFGREEIIIGEEDTAQTGSHNTRVHTFCLILIHTIIEHTFCFSKHTRMQIHIHVLFDIYTRF